MLKAFKVELVDLKNKKITEFFFPSYKWAYMAASKKAEEVYFGYTVMYENVGKETFVEMQRFERDYNFKKDEKDKEKKIDISARKETMAVGATHEKRWKNAMKNENVPIIIKKRSKVNQVNAT